MFYKSNIKFEICILKLTNTYNKTHYPYEIVHRLVLKIMNSSCSQGRLYVGYTVCLIT